TLASTFTSPAIRPPSVMRLPTSAGIEAGSLRVDARMPLYAGGCTSARRPASGPLVGRDGTAMDEAPDAARTAPLPRGPAARGASSAAASANPASAAGLERRRLAA